MAHFVFACLLLGGISSYAQSPNPQRLYEMGMDALTAIGPDRNTQSGVDYIRRSAESGYPPAEVMLGSLYDTGTFVVRDLGQATTWYKKAAMQDDPIGEWLLGRLIVSGAIPPRDLNEASRWLQKAASHNDPFGQYLLGTVKLERQDYSQAALWFRKAAMQGMPQAQQQLGLLLKQGQGINLDKFEAYVWLLMSYEGGNQSNPVANALGQLQGELSPNQIEQAKAKARDLQQTVSRVIVARGCTGWQGEFNTIPAPPPPDIQNFCR